MIRLGRLAALTAATLFVGAGVAGPAGAYTGTGTGATTSDVTVAVSDCVLYHSAKSFGKDCSGATDHGKHIIDYLPGGGPFDPCAYQLADDAEQAEMAKDPANVKPGHAYIKTCLVGVDINKSPWDQHLQPPTTDFVWLTDQQAQVLIIDRPPGSRVWQLVAGTYPAPVLNLGPAGTPRVNIPTWAWLDDATSSTHVIGVNAVVPGGDQNQPVQMRAVVTRVEVQPGLHDATGADVTLRCSGSVAWQQAYGLYSTPPDACIFTYPAGSASQHNTLGDDPETFPVTVTSYFQVQYSVAGGAWQPMPGEVPKVSQRNLTVNEIQTLNR